MDIVKEMKFELAIRSDYPDRVECFIHNDRYHYSKQVDLSLEEGYDILYLLHESGPEAAANKALIYYRKKVFETRPLSERVTERTDNLVVRMNPTAYTVLKTIAAYCGRAFGSVESFVDYILSLSDEDAMKIRNFGKARLDSLHKIQDVLKNADLNTFLAGCDRIY